MMSIKRLFTRRPVLSRVYGRNQYRSFSPLSQMDPRQNKWIGIVSLSVLGSLGYGVWVKQRADTFIDHSIKKGIEYGLAKEMEKRKLLAQEEWEQLKYHIKKSYIDIREPPVYIDRPLLHLKLAQSISRHTVASGKPRVVIIENEKGLGKSVAFRKAAKLFAESLNDPSKNPKLIIPQSIRSINTYVLYLNLQSGLASALDDISIKVKDDLEALRTIKRCFSDAEKNKYRIVLLLDEPGGIYRTSSEDVQILFRGVCKDIIESDGYIYAVTSREGLKAFEGHELDKSRKKIIKNDDWFRATEHEQKMMIDGFIQSVKDKSRRTFVVKADKSYPNDGAVCKAYNTMKDEEAFKQQNLGDIALFLNDRYRII